MSAFPFSFPVLVRGIDRDGRTFRLEADAVQREKLARDLGILSIDALRAELKVRPARGGYAVTGTVDAEVAQACVVTLEPVRQEIREKVDMLLVPAQEAGDGMAGAGGAADVDAPDTFENDRIDLGAIASEHVALGLDPYPRAPGVAFEQKEDEAERERSPFAVLAQRKRGE